MEKVPHDIRFSYIHKYGDVDHCQIPVDRSNLSDPCLWILPVEHHPAAEGGHALGHHHLVSSLPKQRHELLVCAGGLGVRSSRPHHTGHTRREVHHLNAPQYSSCFITVHTLYKYEHLMDDEAPWVLPFVVYQPVRLRPRWRAQ